MLTLVPKARIGVVVPPSKLVVDNIQTVRNNIVEFYTRVVVQQLTESGFIALTSSLTDYHC